MNRKFYSIPIFSVVLSFILFGCGGDGADSSEKSSLDLQQNRGDIISAEKMTYDSNVENKRAYERYAIKILKDKNVEKKKLSGKLFNGFIESARICLDINKNNLCDYYEPLTVSNSKGEYTLTVPLIQNGNFKVDLSKPQIVLASRGIDTNTNRKFVAFLKAPLLNDNEYNNIQLTPLSTLALSKVSSTENKAAFDSEFKVASKEVETMMGIADILNNEDNFKQNFYFQKSAQILASTLDNSNERKSLESLDETYKNIIFSGNSYEDTLDGIENEKLKLAVKEAKNIVDSIRDIDLSDKSNRQSISVLVDAKVKEAKVHFRNSDDEFKTDVIDTNNIQDEAIKLRIKEIGLSNVTSEMIMAVKDNNLALDDLDKIEKIENIAALKTLADLLKKKANADSKLFVLKSFISKDMTTLKIFFSHQLDEQSQELLSNVENVKKVYTIIGLKYNIIDSKYDKKENVNTLFFDSPAQLEINPQIYINELMLADSNGIYSKPSPDPTNIEKIRTTPRTGQILVRIKGDDGSYGYGTDLAYVSGSDGVKSEIANLQWQDISFQDGVNDNITLTQAKEYCANANTYGFSDWRLPNVKEAVSATSLNPKISYFANYPETEVIHVSTLNASLDKTMGVEKNGRVASLIDMDNDFWGYKAEKFGVRCVRDINSGSMFPHKAKDNIVAYSENISYDPTLRIMFQDEAYTQAEQDAFYGNIDNEKFGNLGHGIQYCKSLNDKKFGGFSNWRLPNANELYFSLNGDGGETFQNKIDNFGYYITSSSSYIDGTNLNWFTGNFYTRKALDSRTRGFIRCVRNMDETELKEEREVNAPANLTNNRRFVVGQNRQVSIVVPASIFSKYEGVRLTQVHDENLTDIKYEITNILDKNEPFPTFSIKSLTHNGKSIEIGEHPLTKNGIIAERGYFRIYNEMQLTGDTYGKRKFKTDDNLTLVVNNRVYDVTIHIKIGTDSVEDPNPDINATDIVAPILKVPSAGTIEVSSADGNRIDGNSNIVVFHPNAKFDKNSQDKQKYRIIEEAGEPRINKLEIIGGNNDGIFKVQTDNLGFISIRVDENKVASLTPQEYTLKVQGSNGYEKSNIIDLNVKIINPAQPTLIQDISLDLANAQEEKSWSSHTRDGRLILFTFSDTSSPYYKDKFVAVESLDGLQSAKKEFSGSSENYEIVKFDNYSTEYGIVVKDGKKRANESINVTMRLESDGKIYTATTTITISGAGSNEPVVNAANTEFQKAIVSKKVKDDSRNGDFVGETIFDKSIDMKFINSNTKFSVEPAGILDIKVDDVKPVIYPKIKDNTKLTSEVFNEADNFKTFTIKAITAGKETQTMTLRLQLLISDKPILKTIAPIEIYEASGYRVKGGTNIISFDVKDINHSSEFNIIEKVGEPKINSLEIVGGNEKGYFKIEHRPIVSDSLWAIVVNNEKLNEISIGNYLLRLRVGNGKVKSNEIDLIVKVKEQIPPTPKQNASISLSKKQSGTYDESSDGRTVYYRLVASEPGSYSRHHVNLIKNLNGFKEDQIKFDLIDTSDNYEIVPFGQYGTIYYGVVLKDGGQEKPETLHIKITGTYKGSKIKSISTILKITN